jgi:transcription antitermination protein NusB
MISRRTIRIKVLQILYAYYSSPEPSLNSSDKELRFALTKTYDLYHYVLALLIELADFARRRIDTNKAKMVPLYEDLNPNSRFADTTLINQLRENRSLQTYLRQSGPSWVNHPELIRDLFQFLSESSFYKEYMNAPEVSYADERRFVEKILQNVILISEDLYILLEEESIYWNDDLDLVVAMVLKTLKGFSEKSDEFQLLLPMYKDIEDEQFSKELFRKAVINHDELRKCIDSYASNWDLERIAFMDILIMQLALAEFLYFPSIPTKVTLNEYIELSKYYSTDKSRNFINGILDKSLKELRLEGKITKSGRGLIGETS